MVNTHVPYGVPLPMHGNPLQLQRVIDTGRPLVSDLYFAPTVGRLLTSVDVPVLRHGEVLYVLSMQYFGERLGAILTRQNIPPDITATIYDSSARIIWRSRGSRGDVGQRADPGLAGGLLLEPEGTVDELGPDAVPYVTVFSRSAVSNWTVAIALRRGALNAALWRSLAWIALGALAMFTLGLALVRVIGSHIERSIRGLVRPAIALGCVDNGRDAIARARAERPDLILMNIVLKGDMDGIAAASVIGKELHIPVLFLSAYSDDQTVARAADAWPHGYLTKPFQNASCAPASRWRCARPRSSAWCAVPSAGWHRCCAGSAVPSSPPTPAASSGWPIRRPKRCSGAAGCADGRRPTWYGWKMRPAADRCRWRRAACRAPAPPCWSSTTASASRSISRPARSATTAST